MTKLSDSEIKQLTDSIQDMKGGAMLTFLATTLALPGHKLSDKTYRPSLSNLPLDNIKGGGAINKTIDVKNLIKGGVRAENTGYSASYRSWHDQNPGDSWNPIEYLNQAIMFLKFFPAASLEMVGNGTARYKVTIFYDDNDKTKKVSCANGDPNEAIMQTTIVAALLKRNL